MDLYDQLWAEAVAAFERGAPDLDRRLYNKSADARRGVTLLVRPGAEVCARVRSFLEQVAEVCPGQHFYRPEELHVTVLSIITGTEAWRQEMRRLAACRPILRAVLAGHGPFRIAFRGVTASPGSILVQGFPEGDSLARIREALRLEFARAGLGDLLDRRYRIAAAHMTAVRFYRPGLDWTRLKPALESARDMDFGSMEARCVELVFSDWYASAETVRILEKYDLSRPANGLTARPTIAPGPMSRS